MIKLMKLRNILDVVVIKINKHGLAKFKKINLN